MGAFHERVFIENLPVRQLPLPQVLIIPLDSLGFSIFRPRAGSLSSTFPLPDHLMLTKLLKPVRKAFRRFPIGRPKRA